MGRPVRENGSVLRNGQRGRGMFESLQNKLNAVFEKLATRGRLSEQDVNAALREAAEGPLKGIMHYSEEPIVSIDLNGTSVSCTLDADMTHVIGKRMIKIFGWYDNEWGYSSRLVDLLEHIAKAEA